MEIVNPSIEKYCMDHSTFPSEDCRAIYDFTVNRFSDSQMLIGPWVAGFLGLLIEMTSVVRVLEIGCYTGYSALAMAERLPEHGRLITIDRDAEKGLIAETFWEKTPHGGKIALRIGDAGDVIANLDGSFDLVFIDADKANYILYLEQVLPLLSASGFIAADNTLWYGTVLNKKAGDPDENAIRQFNRHVKERADLTATLIPMRDGITLVRKR